MIRAEQRQNHELIREAIVDEDATETRFVFRELTAGMLAVDRHSDTGVSMLPMTRRYQAQSLNRVA
jgi:hypothetical protein